MDSILNQLTESFNLLADKIYGWLDSIVLSLPNIILVIITLWIGVRLIGFFKRKISILVNKKVASPNLQDLVSNVSSFLLYVLLAILILSILGLQGPITTVLASAGVAGLAVGLALQDPLMNMFSGVIMSVKHVFQPGDFIESNGYIGSVQKVNFKTTSLRMLSGEEVNIPNKMVIQNPIKNFSTNGLRRVDLACGISYNENLVKVRDVAKSAVSHFATKEGVDRPVEFIYTEFGGSSINFQLRIWTDPENVWEYLNLKSEAIISLKTAFDNEGINIPFPIRTLDIGTEGLAQIKTLMNNDK